MQTSFASAHNAFGVVDALLLLPWVVGVVFCYAGFTMLWEIFRWGQKIGKIGKAAVLALMLMATDVAVTAVSGGDVLHALRIGPAIIGIAVICTAIFWFLGISKSIHGIFNKLRHPRRFQFK